MKKQHLFLSGAILVMALIFMGWLYLNRTTDDGTLAQIQQRGSLRVGLDASFPPFESLPPDGQIVGIDVDIAQAIADDLGVTLEIVNIGFDGLYDALLARRVDLVISGLPYDPRWTADVAYTHPYFNAGQILIVRHDETAINQVEDLARKTVAIEWGSQADMEARQLQKTIPTLEIMRQSTAQEAISAVLDGQAPSAIVDAVSGTAALPQGLRIVTYLTDEWYVAAVHIESQALLEAVNQTLTRLERDGDMAEIQARWLHGQ